MSLKKLTEREKEFCELVGANIGDTIDVDIQEQSLFLYAKGTRYSIYVSRIEIQRVKYLEPFVDHVVDLLRRRKYGPK